MHFGRIPEVGVLQSLNSTVGVQRPFIDGDQDEGEETICQYRGADRATAFILFLLVVVSQQRHGQTSFLAY